MVRLTAKDDAIAVGHHRSLFRSTAIVVLICAAAGMRSACAQSVTGSGAVDPGPIQTPNWVVGDQLNVGDGGVGTLTIANGGTVSSTFGVVGNNPGDTGSIIVSGTDGHGNASTWNTNNIQVYIGNGGTGSLLIEGGGQVDSNQGLIGYLAGSTGSVTVSGADSNNNPSTWTAADNIYVGFAGTGTLNVTDGGTVTTSAAGGGDAAVYIGYSAGSSGTVIVSSSTANVSTLSASDQIDVGLDGAGTLTIEKGGFVSAANVVYVAAGAGSGTLNILGDASGRGVLETGQVVNGNGTGILNLNGGILRANSDQRSFLNGFHTLTVGSEGAWFDTNGYNIGIHTAFSGSSSFNKLGLGTLTLTGDSSSFTGTTTISAGTLQLGHGGTSGIIGGNVIDNGTLAFNRSDVVTFASVISGAGTVSQIGSGTMTLTGTNTYTGGTTISGGTLVGSTTSFGSGAITDNSALVINQPVNTTFANAIDGTGSFTTEGAGALNYTGTGSLTGPTTVAAGLLAVNGSLANSPVTVQSGATLGGNGTVGATTIQAGGTIAPGNSIGTLHVNGAFTQAAGATYQVQVNPNSNASDLIAVTGSATLANGSVLNVTQDPPGNYRVGTQYTVLTVTGGLSGTYVLTGQTTSVSAFLSLRDFYDANDAYLRVIQSQDLTGAAQTSNQLSTAGGLDSLGSGNPLGTAVLNAPTNAVARSDFDQLSGEAQASAKGMLIATSQLVRDTALDRLRAAFCTDAYPPTSPTGDGRNAVPASGTASGAASGAATGCATSADRFSVWGKSFGNWGHAAGGSGVAAIDDSTGGFLIGVDVPVADSWRVGVFSGYSNTNFNVDARNSTGDTDNYHLGAYGGAQWEAWGLRLGTSYTWNNISTNRSVTLPDFSDALRANYDAGTAQAFSELGYRVHAGLVTLEPFVNLAYVNLQTDGFTESGGAAALHSQGDTMDDTFITLGVRPSAVVAFSQTSARLSGMVGWRHTFGDVTPSSVVSFAGSSAFTVEGAPIARDAAVIELEADFALSRQASLGLTYAGQDGGGTIDQSIQGNFTVKF